MKKLFFCTVIFSLSCGSLSSLNVTITNKAIGAVRVRTAEKEGVVLLENQSNTFENVKKGDRVFAAKNINSNNFDIACPKITKDQAFQAFQITRETEKQRYASLNN